MITHAPVRVLVVGLGVHARRGHVDHFAASGLQLAAVCDPSQESVSEFRAAYPDLDVPAFHDYGEALACPGIDAVMIMSPDRFHADQAKAAVDAGLHVFCEKPLADSDDSLLVLRQALTEATSRGLIFSTCHPRRFDRPFLWLKDRLPHFVERFGDPLEFRFDFAYFRPSRGGLHHGLLIDHLGHEIDTMAFLFGRRPFVAHRLFDSQTRYLVSGIRDDGLAFSFSGSRTLDAPTYPELAAVRFERGDVTVGAFSGIATINPFGSGAPRTALCGNTDYAGRFAAVNANFAAAIRQTETPYVSHSDMLLNTECPIRLTHGASPTWFCSGTD